MVVVYITLYKPSHVTRKVGTRTSRSHVYAFGVPGPAQLGRQGKMETLIVKTVAPLLALRTRLARIVRAPFLLRVRKGAHMKQGRCADAYLAKNPALTAGKCLNFAGMSRSRKIDPLGHKDSQVPHSLHLSGSI